MNKKISAMALTAAIVCTSASAFAAANPFADVPRDHWAYDAVAELADEGIIEGYGDGTYRGENEITRYEMAQMVAKAMAKEDQANAQQKAMIDRLAAEFSAELSNLGVRVANLEDRIDNVKWGGEMRYTASKRMFHDGPDSSLNRLELRLKPVATINDHWLVRARIDGRADMKNDTTKPLELKQANVEGHYGNWTIEAGLLPVTTEQGVVYDDNLSGGQVTYATDKVTAVLTGGRISADRFATRYRNGGTPQSFATDTGDFGKAALTFRPNSKFDITGEYIHISGLESKGYTPETKAYGSDTVGIWGIGANYKFDKNVKLSGYYGENTKGDLEKKYNRNFNAELRYKGASKADHGSFGLYAAYRHLGNTSVVAPTFGAFESSWKGWEVGGEYTFAKNIVGYVAYVDGENIADRGTDVKKIWSRIKYFF